MSRAALTSSGVTDAMIRSALVAGRLHRIRQGVYIEAAMWPPEPREQHLLRAVAELTLHPTGVLSHQSAATAWGLPHPGFSQWYESGVSITLPRAEAARSRVKPARHHVAPLPAAQVTRDAGGRPVTSLARTAVDLAAGRPLPDGLVILDGAARLLCAAVVAQPRRSDYANPRLRTAVRQLFEQSAPSRCAATLLLAIDLADPRRESATESLSAGHFALAGLPEPLCQPRLETPIGQLYPDFYWPEQMLIGECDGAVKYADAQGYVREKEREQALRDQGYAMVRWQAKEIMLRPEVVVERVARCLN